MYYCQSVIRYSIIYSHNVVTSTFHGGNSEGRMGLETQQLKFKVNGYATLQRESLCLALTNGSRRKLYALRKLGRVHHWVGMNGD